MAKRYAVACAKPESARDLGPNDRLGTACLHVATLRNPQGLAIAHANMAHESFIRCDDREAAK